MNRMTPHLIADTLVIDYLKKNGQNPDDYRMVEVDEFRDVMNSRDFEHQGLKKHVVLAELAEKAAVIDYDFTHTGIKLYNEEDEVIGEPTVGLGYDDVATPTAFSVEDLYLHLKKPLQEPEREAVPSIYPKEDMPF